MTIEEKNTCITICNAILSKDIQALAAEIYPDEDLSNLEIQGFGIAEISNLLTKTIKQLLMEFKIGNWKFLSEIFMNTDKNTPVYSLVNQLNYILVPINNSSSFTDWIPELLVIVRYEMRNGFWESSKKRVHNPKDLSLAKAQAKIGVLIQTLNSALTDTKKAQERLELSIENLDDFTTQKDKQFKSLDQDLELVSQSLTSIRNTEKEVATSNGKISTLLEQTDKALEASRKR